MPENTPEFDMSEGSIVSEQPRIFISPNKYGEVSPQAIANFKDAWRRLDPKHRLLTKNVTYVMGLHPEGQTKGDFQGVEEANIVRIDAEYYASDVYFTKIAERTAQVDLLSLTAAIGIPPDIDWNITGKKYNELLGLNLARTIRNSLATEFDLSNFFEVLEIAKLVKRADKDSPEMTALLDNMASSFDAHVSQSYKALLNERSIKYQATDEAFSLNNDDAILTVPQREYLDGLNKLVTILGIPTGEFDREFRQQLSEQVMGVYAQIQFALSKGYADSLQTPADISDQLPSIADRQAKVTQSGKFDSRQIFERKEFDKLTRDFRDRRDELATRLQQKVNEEITTHGNSLTNSIWSTLSEIGLPVQYELIKAGRTTPQDQGLVGKLKAESEAAENLLQRLAAGTVPMPSLNYTPPKVRSCGLGFTAPTIAELVHSSLENVVITKIADEPLKIDALNILQRMKQLLPEALKTEEQLQQPTEDKTQKLAKDRLQRVKRQTEEDQKTLAEKEKSLKATKPYVQDAASSVFQRIQTEGNRKTIHPSTPLKQAAYIASMQSAWRTLQAFAKIKDLDAQIPAHKRLGDTLFSNGIMTLFEYVYAPADNANPPPNIRSDAKDEAREALKAIYALKQNDNELAPEDLAAHFKIVRSPLQGDEEPIPTPEITEDKITTVKNELQNLRYARNEQLKAQLRKNPELIIVALGTAAEVQNLRDSLAQLGADDSNDKPHGQIHRQIRDTAYRLLNDVGANIEAPVPELVIITTNGRVIVTEESFAPPESQRLVTLRPSDLNIENLTNVEGNKLIEADTAIDKLIAEATSTDNMPEFERLNGIKTQISAIFENENHARDAFLQRIGHVFATRQSLDLPLSEAIIPISPTPETPIPTNVANYTRPIAESVGIAEDFIYSGLAHDPPHALFSCCIDPSMDRRHPLVLKMYHYGPIEAYGRITVDYPPLVRTLQTGDDLRHALATLQAVQEHVLHLPGVTSYARIDRSRVCMSGDVLIPNQPVINGGGHGELFRNHGMLFARLQYGPPNVTEAEIPLQLTQGGHNYGAAQHRTDAIIHEIVRRQALGDIVSQHDMEEWVLQNFDRQYSTAHDNVCRLPVHFPQNEETLLIGGSPYREGYPTEMWKFNLSFQYDGHVLRHINHTFALHVSDWQTALHRRDKIMESIKFMLEHENDRAIWDMINENTLDTRHRTPAEGPPHEWMDESRIDHICHIAASYETNHKLVIRDRAVEKDGSLVVTFGIQRTNQGDGIDEWFYEEHANPQNPPVIMERTITFPPSCETAEDNAQELEERAQTLLQEYLLQDYSSFRPPNAAGVQGIKRPKQYQPSSMRLLLETVLYETMRDNEGGLFTDCTPGFPPPPPRTNGHNGGGHTNGNGDGARYHHQPFADEQPMGSWKSRAVRNFEVRVRE